MRIVELIGAPCSGKSTVAMGLVYMLRQEGFKAELVTEVAKDLYWEGILAHISQKYITRNQIAKVEAVASHSGLDFIICDSAITVGEAYATQSELVKIKEMIDSFYKKMDTMAFFIDCTVSYTSTGRLQSLEDALRLKQKLLDTAQHHVDILTVEGVPTSQAVTTIKGILLNS